MNHTEDMLRTMTLEYKDKCNEVRSLKAELKLCKGALSDTKGVVQKLLMDETRFRAKLEAVTMQRDNLSLSLKMICHEALAEAIGEEEE